MLYLIQFNVIFSLFLCFKFLRWICIFFAGQKTSATDWPNFTQVLGAVVLDSCLSFHLDVLPQTFAVVTVTVTIYVFQIRDDNWLHICFQQEYAHLRWLHDPKFWALSVFVKWKKNCSDPKMYKIFGNGWIICLNVEPQELLYSPLNGNKRWALGVFLNRQRIHLSLNYKLCWDIKQRSEPQVAAADLQGHR